MSEPIDTEQAAWLTSLFSPRSVALVGASDSPDRATGRIQYYLDKWNYSGVVYPVNPKRDVVQGRPAFASVSAIPDRVDVAVILVPAHAVAAALTDCADAGVGVVVVGSSGFSEVGEAGAALEAELVKICRERGIRMVGPNGNGVISAGSKFTASFMSGLDTDRFDLRDDGVGLISQSGAVGAYIFNMGQSSGLGVSKFASTGNEANIGFAELVAGLVTDPTSRAVLGYIEGLRDGPAFVNAACDAQRAGVPLAVLKVGTTDQGASAAASHTASLAGSDNVYDGVFRQLGVVRARSINQLLDVGHLLAGDRPVGPRLTVATISGGAGILVTDRAIETGLELAEWDEDDRAKLRPFLPDFASVANPIDTTGQMLTDASTAENVLKVIETHENTDVAIVILGNGERFEDNLAGRIEACVAEMSKLVVVVWPGGSGHAIDRLNRAGIPSFEDPVRCVEALAAVADASGDLGRLPELGARAGCAVPAAEVVALDEYESKQLLAKHGLPVVVEQVVSEASDLTSVIESIGLPMVAKLRSRSLQHKSDIGAVRLNLTTADQVARAVSDLFALGHRLDVADADVVLAPFVDAAFELIVGGSIDPTFGPVVTIGFGGTFTEIVRDAVVLLPDFSDEQLERALSSLSVSRLFAGHRGSLAVDRQKLATAVRAVATAISSVELDAQSIDVNPLVVTMQGDVVAVDAVIELDPSKLTNLELASEVLA